MSADEMRVIGLTGGIGSGKSTVADLFSELGVPVIDTDKIAHALSYPPSPVLHEIKKQFGADFLAQDGSLNRAKIRQCIYAKPTEKVKLEAIFHPQIKQEVLKLLEEIPKGARYTILAVPLLFETSDYLSLIDRSLVVDCPIELQISRVVARNGFSRNEIMSIIASQCPRATRLELADDIILNETTLADLKSKVNTLHQQYQD